MNKINVLIIMGLFSMAFVFQTHADQSSQAYVRAIESGNHNAVYRAQSYLAPPYCYDLNPWHGVKFVRAVNGRVVKPSYPFIYQDMIHLKVRIARAHDIKHRDEILNAQLVVLGSPSYFGNMSWQVKRLVDERFGVIYASCKERLGRKKVAVFSMAEIETSARENIRTITRAIRDCRGVMGPTMSVLTKHNDEEINSRIQDFAVEIAKTLNN